MPLSNEKKEEIKEQILDCMSYDWKNITAKLSEKLSLSKQTINMYLRELTQKGFIEETGKGRTKKYRYKYIEYNNTYTNKDIDEDFVWREFKPKLNSITNNALHILQYGFTEMVNNAIEHSEAEQIGVKLRVSKYKTTVYIWDNGVGIFDKIYNVFQLEDKRYAILELAKGKLTSDPENHTGEGVFFTSRAMDGFNIFSSGLCFIHDNRLKKDYLLDNEVKKGTIIYMSIKNNSERKLVDVFNEFTGDDNGFSKTVIPIELAQIEGDALISRSQAKRILARCEKFKEIVLDFEGIVTVGQGFADQIFRVFANEHPEINIQIANTSEDVLQMILHVQTK